MKVNRRVDLTTKDLVDVRFIEDLLIGQYDNVYITFSTIDDEHEAWQDQNDSFLSIALSRDAVLSSKINYKREIINSLPLLEWLDYRQLTNYVEERMQA